MLAVRQNLPRTLRVFAGGVTPALNLGTRRQQLECSEIPIENRHALDLLRRKYRSDVGLFCLKLGDLAGYFDRLRHRTDLQQRIGANGSVDINANSRDFVRLKSRRFHVDLVSVRKKVRDRVVSALVCRRFFLCLVCGFMIPTASGQAVYGSIAGTVTDPQGGGVAGAKVVVTTLTKGTTEEATTNESGNYTVTHLLADTYKVHVEAPGFKSYEITTVRVDVDTTVRADALLQVGAVTQSVEVTSEIPQLQTEKTDVATIFSTQEVESVPIFNRNFTTFQLLSPGAQIQGWGPAASENPQGSRQVLTNGQHFAGTGFELDVTDNQDPSLGLIVLKTNLESINEAKITSQDYDAEFGKAIGAIVTSQTKSGTNEIHGSAFDFERSNSNFASDPFSQTPSKIAAGQRQVPSGNWNQFGGTIGGPIKKNKYFAFGDYHELRAQVGGTAQEHILTAAERGGNLSNLGRNNYDPYQFNPADPTHCTVLKDATGQPIPASLTQRNQSTQFPGNVIPACRMSSQVQNLLKLLPTGATLADPTANNFSGSSSNVLNADNFDARGDYVLNTKTQVFGRYSYQKFLRSGPGLFGDVAGGAALPADSGGPFAGNSQVRNQSLATGFCYKFSPTLLTR